ncbi:8-amino-7-oxononanoate synthase [Thiosulfativibrio zosterae]|uniref:8-amino-7-oxononanoate synthase n=1 Tax=Thiosulfativibrio zosterae TaxID=2675053 RepID=A0A6F8PK68_9GAMM|nr:8-amino-7-oxononanoate synthase [Thiosulfativibrio zosterae]BBP42454.1 8-amino-7-oxononanoate synthase [Thiosulfativibrio zosterae]
MNKPSIEQRFAPLLQARQAQNLYRARPLALSAQQPSMQINGKQVINFSSNDYLGLANAPELKNALQQTLSQNLSVGSGAAHLVTGHSLEHHLLEDELADWLGVERVLLFSTGYMANLAVQQVLMQKGDLILGDKLNHASLIDGALQSDADFKRYAHNDMSALEKRLSKTQHADSATLIVSDGVFSMDGDLTKLPELQKLAKNNQAWLFLDDAHGFGALGKHGKGCFEYFDCQPDTNTILMGTLGKAFGVSGAFVAGSQTLIETLINFARPYIYTTAMSPMMAAAGREALRLVKQADARREHLNQLIQQFRIGASQLGLPLMDSPSAIQPIVLGDAATALAWSEQLKQQGFWVGAIRPPTVPHNTARLRITLSAAHTAEQVDSLLEALAACQHSHTLSR